MYRVIARLMMPDGSVYGYRLYDLLKGREFDVDKVTAWQYAKAGCILDVKPTGSFGSNTIGLSGTNGFELKALPSIKQGASKPYTDKQTHKVFKIAARPDEKPIDIRKTNKEDAEAALVRDLLRGEIDPRLTRLGSSGDYLTELGTIKQDAIAKQIQRNEINVGTFRRCSRNIIVTSILYNGYSSNYGVTAGNSVGCKIVNNSNDSFSIPRLSEEGISQNEVINLSPGGSAYINNAELAVLASDPRISFRLGNAKVMCRIGNIESICRNATSWRGLYSYLRRHSLVYDKSKIRGEDVKHTTIDKATVEKYYTPESGVRGTNNIYTTAVESMPSTITRESKHFNFSRGGFRGIFNMFKR